MTTTSVLGGIVGGVSSGFGSSGMGDGLPEPGAAAVLLDHRDADAALGGDDPRHVQTAQIALTIAERGSAPALDRVERPWFGRLPAGSLDLAPADRPAETDDLARCLRQVDRWRSQRPWRRSGRPAAASDDLIDHRFCHRR